MTEPRPHWFLTCSCGWSRECISRWAAESVAKLHPRLSGPGTEHTIAIEELIRVLMEEGDKYWAEREEEDT